MSALSAIQNLFSPASATQPVAQVPGNIPATGGQATPENPMVPAAATGTENLAQSPLGDFKDLWEADPNAKPTEPMFAGVDPQKLMDAAGKTDFSKIIGKDHMAAIAAGGAGGVEASMQAMNKMAQAVYANSAMATTKIVEQALAKQQASFEAKLPGIIKQHTLSDTLRSENPALSNPAVKPFIQAMEQQLAVKHPGATAAELTAMAKQYVEGVGALFSPAPAMSAAETAKAGETDWTKFFE